MHDIDAQISRISGQNNYMESLQKITGNIMTVEMDRFRDCHKRISACDFNINVILKRLVEKEPENKTISKVAEEYVTESSKLNIKDNTFVMYKRKSKKHETKEKEIIDQDHLPSALVKSNWFKNVKHIEKTINKFFNTIFTAEVKPSDRKWEQIAEDYKQHPELLDIRTIYDCKLDDENMFNNLKNLQKCCNVIINSLLTPMYDVEGTIRKHWPKIADIFKMKAFQQSGASSMTVNDIIGMLEKFIIAKYRATITGNNKHYVKLFLNTVGDENVSKMDGARFMEVMDSIDLDKLDKKENVYKFALTAKNTMKKIINNENINAEQMLEEMDRLFNEDEGDNETGETNDEDNNKYDDII